MGSPSPPSPEAVAAAPAPPLLPELVTRTYDTLDPTGEKAMAAKIMRDLDKKIPLQLQYDADVLLHALCKPWEVGGHAHDFRKCHRQARITDPYEPYATELIIMQWHERIVSQKEAWNRQRQLKGHMLFLLSKLQIAERERRRTIEKRRRTHPEEEPAEFTEVSGDLKQIIDRYLKDKPSEVQPFETAAEVIVKPENPPDEPASMVLKPDDPPTEPATLLPLSGEKEIVIEVPSPRTIALRQEVKDLDLFDEKLQPPEPEVPVGKKKK